MNSSLDLGSRLWRLLQRRLWILAVVLGAATLYSAASAIHDTERRREAARVVAKATAEHIAALGSARLEVKARDTFDPVTPWRTASALTEEAAVFALARGQLDAERCGCRETLPASEYFHLSVATDSLVSMATAYETVPMLLPPALVSELAHQAALRPRGPQLSVVHLWAGVRLGEHAVITLVQYDDRGTPVAVSGLVANARETARALFGNARPRVGLIHSSTVLARLDTLSVQIATIDSVPLFGTLGEEQPYRATVYARGPLEALTVTVALALSQIPSPLRVFVPTNERWHLGILLLCTALVTAVAIGSTRREALLARARSDFIAGVSHELRMPLAQILLASETLSLKRERDETERTMLASSIVRETHRLIALVENVLLFSRSGAVELRPLLQPVPVSALFDDVVETVQLAVADAGHTIEVREAPSLVAVGDRHLLRQALVNLIDNALKYGRAGQRIHLGAEQPSPSLVRLYVDDDGPGVPAADRDRVFERYERLERDQSSERTGTGLGLAVVRQIARACGGQVWLEDAPGGGTRAVIELRSSDVREPTRGPSEVA